MLQDPYVLSRMRMVKKRDLSMNQIEQLNSHLQKAGLVSSKAAYRHSMVVGQLCDWVLSLKRSIDQVGQLQDLIQRQRGSQAGELGDPGSTLITSVYAPLRSMPSSPDSRNRFSSQAGLGKRNTFRNNYVQSGFRRESKEIPSPVRSQRPSTKQQKLPPMQALSTNLSYGKIKHQSTDFQKFAERRLTNPNSLQAMLSKQKSIGNRLVSLNITLDERQRHRTAQRQRGIAFEPIITKKGERDRRCAKLGQ